MACTCPAACRSGDGACLPWLAGCTQVVCLPLAMPAVDTAVRCASWQAAAKLANHCASCRATVQAGKPLCRAPPQGGRVPRAGVPLHGTAVSIKFSFVCHALPAGRRSLASSSAGSQRSRWRPTMPQRPYGRSCAIRWCWRLQVFEADGGNGAGLGQLLPSLGSSTQNRAAQVCQSAGFILCCWHSCWNVATRRFNSCGSIPLCSHGVGQGCVEALLGRAAAVRMGALRAAGLLHAPLADSCACALHPYLSS